MFDHWNLPFCFFLSSSLLQFRGQVPAVTLVVIGAGVVGFGEGEPLLFVVDLF